MSSGSRVRSTRHAGADGERLRTNLNWSCAETQPDKAVRQRQTRATILKLTSEAESLDEPDPSVLQRSSALAGAIDSVPEALLDSKLCVLLGQKALRASSKTTVHGIQYSPEEFIMRIKNLFKNCPGSSNSTTGYSSGFQYLSGLLIRRDVFPKVAIAGSFSCEELKEKPARKKAIRDTQRDEHKTVVSQVSPQEGLEEVTTWHVDRAFRALQRLDALNLMPIDFFEFVIDPSSFSESVENIFHLSFLVRQGKVVFYIDNEGTPSLALAKSSSKEQEGADTSSVFGSSLNEQDSAFVSGDDNNSQQQDNLTPTVTLTWSHWKQLIDVYDLSGKSIIAKLTEKEHV